MFQNEQFFDSLYMSGIGSTFLTELVASNLKNMRYFIYEPLMSRFRVNRVRDKKRVKEALNILRTIISCRYDQIEDDRHFIMEAMHHRNPYLWQNMWDKVHTAVEFSCHGVITR